MARIKNKKLTSTNKPAFQMLECRICGKLEKRSEEAIAVTCSSCFAKMVEPPPIRQEKINIGPVKPRGWHFKHVFVDTEGNVFHKGVEQPKLKGTLEPTPIEVNKKPESAKPKKTKHELDMEKRKLFEEKNNPYGKDVTLYRVEGIRKCKQQFTFALEHNQKFKFFNVQYKKEMKNKKYTDGIKIDVPFTLSGQEYKSDKSFNILLGKV